MRRHWQVRWLPAIAITGAGVGIVALLVHFALDVPYGERNPATIFTAVIMSFPLAAYLAPLWSPPTARITGAAWCVCRRGDWTPRTGCYLVLSVLFGFSWVRSHSVASYLQIRKSPTEYYMALSDSGFLFVGSFVDADLSLSEPVRFVPYSVPSLHANPIHISQGLRSDYSPWPVGVSRRILTLPQISPTWTCGGTAVWAAYWIPTGLCFIGVARALVRGNRRFRQRMEGLCLNCGYNLTGNTSGRCPECGTEVEG